jgi:hypothetical protein
VDNFLAGAEAANPALTANPTQYSFQSGTWTGTYQFSLPANGTGGPQSDPSNQNKWGFNLIGPDHLVDDECRCAWLSRHNVKVLVWALSFCLIAMTEGCSRQTRGPPVYKTLRPLTDAFGVKWPTNCISQKAGSWNFYAPLDAGSRNTRVVARLEIDAPTFSAWRKSATNQMREYAEFVVLLDENLTRKFS